MTFRYRLEHNHNPYCEEHNNRVLNSLIKKEFEFVIGINISVAYNYFEIMIDTNKRLTEEELQNLLEYFKPAVCTSFWEC